MSATVAAARLKEAAAWANRGIPGRPPAPIMAAAVLSVEDGRLTALGFDWETLARVSVEAFGDLPRTLVSGRLLTEVTSNMTGEADLHLDGSRLVISARSSRFRLPVMAADQYPTIPADVPASGVATGVADAIRRVAPSAAKDATLKFSNLNLAVRGGELVVSALNRHIMSQARVPWDGEPFEANPSARRILDVARHLDDKVSLGFDHLLAIWDDRRYAALTVHDEPAANFAQADADLWSGNGHVDVDRENLGRAIADVRPMLSPGVATIRLSVDQGELTLRSLAGDMGDAMCDVPAAVDGEAREIAVSADYLGMALEGLDHCEVVRIQFGPTVKRSFLVTGVIDDARDPSTRHIIQPIRLPEPANP